MLGIGAGTVLLLLLGLTVGSVVAFGLLSLLTGGL